MPKKTAEPSESVTVPVPVTYGSDTTPRSMSTDELAEAMGYGRTLHQSEQTAKGEVQDLDNFIQLGHAVVDREWTYDPDFQCITRKVRGVLLQDRKKETE